MISIVIPVRNRFSLLHEAVESILNQEIADFELIVADDGSDEYSLADLRERLPDDPRIRLVGLSPTGRPGLVRNRGAQRAKGELLAFLDSDDLWLPHKLRRQIEVFDAEPGVELVHTREIWLRDERAVSQSGMRHRRSGDVFPDALRKCMIGPSTVMVRASTFHRLGGFREDLEIAEDYELWLRWTALHPIHYIDDPLVVKRAGGWDQLSEKYGQIEKFRIDGLSALVSGQWFRKEAGEGRQRMAEVELARKYRIYANGAAKRGSSEEAAACLAAAASLEAGQPAP